MVDLLVQCGCVDASGSVLRHCWDNECRSKQREHHDRTGQALSCAAEFQLDFEVFARVQRFTVETPERVSGLCNGIDRKIREAGHHGEERGVQHRERITAEDTFHAEQRLEKSWYHQADEKPVQPCTDSENRQYAGGEVVFQRPELRMLPRFLHKARKISAAPAEYSDVLIKRINPASWHRQRHRERQDEESGWLDDSLRKKHATGIRCVPGRDSAPGKVRTNAFGENDLPCFHP